MKNKWEYLDKIQNAEEKVEELKGAALESAEKFVLWREEHVESIEEAVIESYPVITCLLNFSGFDKEAFNTLFQCIEYGFYLGRNYQDMPKVVKEALK